MGQPAQESANQSAERQHLSGDQTPELAKHTPGPWEFEGPLTDWKRKGNAFGWITAKAPFFELYDPKFIPPLDEAKLEANARLIAAAPDMLDALIEARLQIKYMHAKFAVTGTGEAVLAQIGRAIAKATVFDHQSDGEASAAVSERSERIVP